MSDDDDLENDPDVFDEDIEAAMLEFDKSHDGMWIFEAIRRCNQYGRLMPERVRNPFEDALDRYRTAEARTLDEAFGVARPKGWSQSAARSRSRKTGLGISTAAAIYHSIVGATRRGRAIDDGLYEEVGSKHGVSGSTARNYYREIKALLEDERGDGIAAS